MSFARLHKLVTYLLAGLGLFTLSLGGELDLVTVLVLALAFVATIWAEGPRIHGRQWQRGWTLALLVLLVVEIVRGALGEPLLPLALEFTAALQISRLANRRTAAEHQQIAILAFLHLVAATVLSTEVTYGLAFLGFVIVAPWMLALTHLRSEIEGHYPGDKSEPDGAPPPEHPVARVLASRRVVGPSFLVGTASLSIPLFVLTALLFIAFPRVGLGFLAFGRDGGRPVAGFGDDVELGQVGRIRTDATVVMRVTPPDVDPEHPVARRDLRMRGTSFDHYDGRRWSRTRRPGRNVGRLFSYYVLRHAPIAGRDRAWEVVLDHLTQTVVFIPEATVAVEVPPRVVNGVEVAREVTLHPGLDLRYGDDDALGLRYRAWTSPDGRDVDDRELSDADRALYTQLPEGHEALAALARTWTARASTDRERAALLLTRLRDGDYAYTLEMFDPGDRAPLVAFLTEERRGHCEYFASAMAILARTLGIPSRNVTGFLGGRWNAYGGYYAITSADAHSWVELWIEGEGWVSFDPTPSARGEQGVAEGFFDAIGEVIDALRTRWSDDVVGFDLRSQRGMARSIARWWAELRGQRGYGGTDGGRDPSEPSVDAHSERAPLGRWALVLFLLGGVGLAIVLVLRRRLAGATPAAPVERREAREVVLLYRELERVLAERGLGRPAARTPREHASALRESGFAGSDVVSEVTERYLEVRFGGGALEPSELRALRDRVRALSSAE